MRIRSTIGCLFIVSGLFLGLEARGGTYVFDTESTATQTIYSPLLGGSVNLTSHGPQEFTLDTTSGSANVTSEFKGSDFPVPGYGYVTYDLYNTMTTGTVTKSTTGPYVVSFQLLFELKLTGGPLAGLTFETLDNATFTASNIPTIPFPAGTAFSDPGGSDTVNIYVKSDPTNTYAPGTLAGTSSNRLVTINSIVPEPSSLVMALTAGLAGLGLGYARRRGSARSAAMA